MIAKEGYTIVAIVAVSTLLLCLAASLVKGGAGLSLLLAGLVTLAFVLFFFRDPKRTPPPEAHDLLLAPADGKVLEVVEEHEPLYLNGRAQRIGIFLSPLDVHVNRIPADGIIELARYVPGDYLVAWHPKSSSHNERSILGLRHPSGHKILFKQIAGAVARRIVFDITVGDTVYAGDRYGIIKMGSRMDVLVSPDVIVNVSPGDRVRAGETIVGRLPISS